MQTITTLDNTKLFIKDWGSGRPVILMAGWSLSADSWDELALEIAAAGYRAIAYDRRGFGRSSQPIKGYDYDTLSDDLSSVITQTEAKDVTLVGFSMGGGEVARYMSRHNGESVVQTALISSIVPFMLKTEDNPQGTEQAVFDKMTLEIKKDRAKFFSEFFRDFFGLDMTPHPVNDELIDWASSMASQASLEAILKCIKSFSSTDFRGDLSAFKMPTLIIHGTNDNTVPIDATGRAAARNISQSLLIEYDGAPHGLFATNKTKLTRDLLNFLRQ